MIVEQEEDDLYIMSDLSHILDFEMNCSSITLNDTERLLRVLGLDSVLEEAMIVEDEKMRKRH